MDSADVWHNNFVRNFQTAQDWWSERTKDEKKNLWLNIKIKAKDRLCLKNKIKTHWGIFIFSSNDVGRHGAYNYTKALIFPL